jgi:hypothetical protein
VHHAVHPLLTEKVPYNVVVVALDDHPDLRVVGNVIDGGEVRNGARVRLHLDRTSAIARRQVGYPTAAMDSRKRGSMKDFTGKVAVVTGGASGHRSRDRPSGSPNSE